jgi:thiamine biosynthesis lipoprotein ApbE
MKNSPLPLRLFIGRLVFALALLSDARAADSAPWQVFHHEGVLGTSLELRFATRQAAQAAAAEAAALAEFDRLGKILSGYDATSEFRQWLATHDEPRQVSPELFEVLALFDRWRERTGGALDASAEAAGRLWKSAAQDGRVPSADELAATVAAMRQTHWRLDPVAHTATHLSAVPLMLNSFTKSYIIERVCAAALAAGHLESAVVNLGGDIVARGPAASTIAIADPLADGENDEPLTLLAVQDRAVATSGGYRRGVEIAGRWYSHLVDPRTGQPVDHVRSATVVSPRATDAGALATALCVMTPEDGLRLAATVPDTECLLVLADGRLVSSSGWRKNEMPRANVFAAVAAGTPNANADLTIGAPGGWDPSFELAVNFEIATPASSSGPGGGGKGGKGGKGGRGGAKRPFVAIWIEDQEKFPVRTVALWYHGDRWLPDLRAWIRADDQRLKAEGTHLVDTISSATRSPGKYTVKWDGKNTAGQPVPRGKYTVFLEIAREHGTHQVLKQELDFSGEPAHVDFPANPELASASFDYRKKPTVR